MDYIEAQDTELKYQKLDDLGVELGVPIPRAFIECKVVDRDGNTIHHHKQRSHSYVRSFYNILLSHAGHQNGTSNATFGAGYLNLKTTAGAITGDGASLRMVNSTENSHATGGTSVYAGDGVTSYGIIVGTSNDAEDFEDHVLTAPVAHGDGVGQLRYILMSLPVYSYVSGTKTGSSTWTRTFFNADASALDIKEIAMYCVCNAGGTDSQYTMLSRDVVSTITVPAGGMLYVSYTTSLVYPA